MSNNIYSKELVADKNIKINTSKIPDGIYFIEISTKTNSITKKIIISN